MSSSKTLLIGRLGKKPELTKTDSGASVAVLSVATSENYTDKAGKPQERTEWHRVVVWNKLAENCAKYLDKGSLVHVDGSNKTREYDSKEGKKCYITEVVARKVDFLSSNKKDNIPAPSDETDYSTQATPNYADDESAPI